MANEGVETIILQSNLEEMERLTEFLNAFASEHSFPEEITFHIVLAVEELVVNVIMHGYEYQQGHSFPLSMWMEGSLICIRLEDDAKPFNPLEAPDYDVNKALQQERIGGLGITLVRKLMDSVQYSREDGKNVVNLRKDLS